MASATIYGVEQEACPDPDGVGCVHDISIHGQFIGCSYMGTGGWCECWYHPERSGAAQLLEAVITAPYPASPGTRRVDL